MIDNIAAVFQKESFWSNLIALFIAWITPAAELAFLLYGLVTVDWLMDTYLYLKANKSKSELWPTVTRVCVEKLVWYSALAFTAHALQMHFFKDSFPIYKYTMFIPISAEFISITKTVEAQTGVKLVTRIQELIDGWFPNKPKNDDDTVR